MEKIDVLGLPYAALTVEEAVKNIAELARRGRFAAVFTPGATVAAAARRSVSLARLLRSADLLLPDGSGISLAARLCGRGGLPRCPGIEVGEGLLAAAARDGLRVYFYGAAPGVALEAAEAMRRRYPTLSVRVRDGYGDDPTADILAFDPRLVFVCLGAPRQEAWILSHRELPAVCLGLGGSLDVWSGRLRRAPRLWRRLGLEWAYRVWREPRRLTRLLPLPRYFFACLRCGIGQYIQKIKKRRDNYGRI